jgi:crotonobetainyl-CoA:carnitine CoA-transferase CaiB-like acyl-CoA transferase
MDLSKAEIEALSITTNPHEGPLRHLGPVLQLSETQPHWTRPTPALGGDTPEWLVEREAADAAE